MKKYVYHLELIHYVDEYDNKNNDYLSKVFSNKKNLMSYIKKVKNKILKEYQIDDENELFYESIRYLLNNSKKHIDEHEIDFYSLDGQEITGLEKCCKYIKKEDLSIGDYVKVKPHPWNKYSYLSNTIIGVIAHIETEADRVNPDDPSQVYMKKGTVIDYEDYEPDKVTVYFINSYGYLDHAHLRYKAVEPVKAEDVPEKHKFLHIISEFVKEKIYIPKKIVRRIFDMEICVECINVLDEYCNIIKANNIKEGITTFNQNDANTQSAMTVDTSQKEDIDDELSMTSVFTAGTEYSFADIIFCWIPPGKFLMGSPEDEVGRSENEGPQQEITFEEGFWMSKYEITQRQWKSIMGNNPSHFKGKKRPVENVSWNDIRSSGGYLKKLNTAWPGYNFRLPASAEWEYAYRAGTTTRFYWGEDSKKKKIDKYAWYKKNSGGKTHNVGLKQPNAWGLHDMAGNVFEWCEDDAPKDDDNPPDNRSAWVDNPRSNLRVLRGSSWGNPLVHHRAADISMNYADAHINCLGFRIVCDKKVQLKVFII